MWLSHLSYRPSAFLLVIGGHTGTFVSLSLKIAFIIYSAISGADVFPF